MSKRTAPLESSSLSTGIQDDNASPGSSSSSTANQEDGNVIWLHVDDNDEVGEAAFLRVAVFESNSGTGKKKRRRYVCTFTLHKENKEAIVGFKRCLFTVNTDPRDFQDGEFELRQKAMDNFGQQKRVREDQQAGNDDGDGSGGGTCSLPSSIT
jgi:hypothetical protein